MFACIYFEKDASLSVLNEKDRDLVITTRFAVKEAVEMLWRERPGKPKQAYRGVIVKVGDNEEQLSSFANSLHSKFLKGKVKPGDTLPDACFTYSTVEENEKMSKKRDRTITTKLKESQQQQDELSPKKRKSNTKDQCDQKSDTQETQKRPRKTTKSPSDVEKSKKEKPTKSTSKSCQEKSSLVMAKEMVAMFSQFFPTMVNEQAQQSKEKILQQQVIDSDQQQIQEKQGLGPQPHQVKVPDQQQIQEQQGPGLQQHQVKDPDQQQIQEQQGPGLQQHQVKDPDQQQIQEQQGPGPPKHQVKVPDQQQIQEQQGPGIQQHQVKDPDQQQIQEQQGPGLQQYQVIDQDQQQIQEQQGPGIQQVIEQQVDVNQPSSSTNTWTACREAYEVLYQRQPTGCTGKPAQHLTVSAVSPSVLCTLKGLYNPEFISFIQTLADHLKNDHQCDHPCFQSPHVMDEMDSTTSYMELMNQQFMPMTSTPVKSSIFPPASETSCSGAEPVCSPKPTKKLTKHAESKPQRLRRSPRKRPSTAATKRTATTKPTDPKDMVFTLEELATSKGQGIGKRQVDQKDMRNILDPKRMQVLKDRMVKLHIKKGDDSQFLYETTVEQPVDDLLKDVSAIYNGRLKIQRICAEIECLAEHGITLPPNMQGLTDEQVVDLKLKDEWADRCTPQGGVRENTDKVGVRNGQAPTSKMAEVLTKTVKEAKDMISKKKVQADQMVTQATVKEALDILRGAVTIVYPMGLPPHDNIRLEFENNEDLAGTQASLEVIEEQNISIWFSGKEMLRGKILKDYVGKNEKTKIVAKIQKKGQGCPSREPVVSEEEQKQMMAYYYRKQEDMKKLQKEAEDSYLDSGWADNSALKKSFHGIKDIKWGPR